LGYTAILGYFQQNSSMFCLYLKAVPNVVAIFEKKIFGRYPKDLSGEGARQTDVLL
jgi:hypothetical protein